MDESATTQPEPVPHPQVVTRAPGKFQSVLNHPAVRIVERVAALASIPLAVLLYLAGIHKPVLSYYLHATRTTIVSAGGGPLLQTSYAGEQVKDSLTAVQLAIWNAGSAPIRSTDVLEAPRVTIKSPARILSAKLLDVTRPVTGFLIDDTKKGDGSLFSPRHPLWCSVCATAWNSAGT